MSPEKQRIVIAEACRFLPPFETYKEWEDAIDCGPNEIEVLRDKNDRRVPDYLEDLNAIHQAEIAFADQEDGRFIFEFRCALHTILGHDGTMAVHANATQRAEAFLRAIGKWEVST